jgi:hypothetical protein
MTGPLRLDAGTSGVPALAFSAETTTGLYRAGTNDVRFAVATVDVLQLTAAGVTLPLGTANGVLYLNGSKVATSGAGLTFDGTNVATTGTASATKLIPTGGTATGNGMYLPAANTLGFSTNGVLNMSLNASGNLGIGTANPAVKFVVSNGGANGVEIEPLGFSSNNVIQSYNRSGAAYTSLVYNALNHGWALSGVGGGMTLDGSGNLGIGTASPGNRLHVAGSGDISRFTNGTVSLYGYSDSAGLGWFTGAGATGTGAYYNNTSSYQALYTGGTERMRLDISGNLGLNTTAFGTSAAGVLSLGTGTAPTTGPADTVQLFSVDRSAGNTIPAIRCEGSGVTNAGITNTTVTNKIAVQVNGTIYYLLATTNAT